MTNATTLPSEAIRNFQVSAFEWPIVSADHLGAFYARDGGITRYDPKDHPHIGIYFSLAVRAWSSDGWYWVLTAAVSENDRGYLIPVYEWPAAARAIIGNIREDLLIPVGGHNLTHLWDGKCLSHYAKGLSSHEHHLLTTGERHPDDRNSSVIARYAR